MRILLTLSLCAGALACADTLTLKDGRVMNGTYLGGTAREIRLDMGDHVETIPVERVSTLLFDNAAPVAQSAPSAPPPPPPPHANYNDAPPPPPAGYNPQPASS